MALIRVPCAVCGGGAFRARYPSTIPDDDTPADRYFGSSRERAGYLSIVHCESCGLMMTNPQDDPSTLAAIYHAHVDTAYDEDRDNRRRAARDYLAVVEKYYPSKGRLLDVGCGTGAFVRIAGERGWMAEGVDPAEWMIERARAQCPTARFHVGEPWLVELERGSLDVVTLWNVLEHVPDPAKVLRRARMWLAPEGRLVIRVPNGQSVMARLMGRRWVLLLREHLWYFAPKTIAPLLWAEGFEVLDIRWATIPVSMGNVLRRLSQYSGPVSACASHLYRSGVLGGISLRFPIGEMDVVARPR